jgi:cytoskeletal protein CcmA (bactofilin family)
MSVFKRRIQDSAKGPATYIAATTKIVGTVTGEGAYIFCGRVEGDCDISGPVTLAESGHWIGTLKAANVVVAGKVNGDVIADGRVEISGTAKVTGSLAGNSIAVAEGAIIEGEIKVLSGTTPIQFEEKRKA